jgi:hypothetical protein
MCSTFSAHGLRPLPLPKINLWECEAHVFPIYGSELKVTADFHSRDHPVIGGERMSPVDAITRETDSIDQRVHRPYLEVLETTITNVRVLLLLLCKSEVLYNKLSNITMTANTAELCSCIFILSA